MPEVLLTELYQSCYNDIAREMARPVSSAQDWNEEISKITEKEVRNKINSLTNAQLIDLIGRNLDA